VIPWSALAKLAWDSLKEPDSKSLGARVSKAYKAYTSAGEAAELFNEVAKLGEKERKSC
jgi:hypothetical protein